MIHWRASVESNDILLRQPEFEYTVGGNTKGVCVLEWRAVSSVSCLVQFITPCGEIENSIARVLSTDCM